MNYINKRVGKDLSFDLAKRKDNYGDYLEHHGILKMKWGIRRFQNPDGTLTEAGRKRYSRLSKRKERNERKYNTRRDNKKYYEDQLNSPDTRKKEIARDKYTHEANEYDLKAKELVQRANHVGFFGPVSDKKKERLMNEAKDYINDAMKARNRAQSYQNEIDSYKQSAADEELKMMKYQKKIDAIERKIRKLTNNGMYHSDILAHHGILGQKWGVRRFQNKDGSLTNAGKKRYSSDDGKLNAQGVKKFVKSSSKNPKVKSAISNAREHLAEWQSTKEAIYTKFDSILRNADKDFISDFIWKQPEGKAYDTLQKNDIDKIISTMKDQYPALSNEITKSRGSIADELLYGYITKGFN